MRHATLYSDGGTRGGNPGLSACGIVIIEDDIVVAEGALLIGPDVSNNEAEYGGLISGLWNCAELGFTHVHAITDSQIMANQMNGEFGVKAANLVPCFEQALIEAARFEQVTYEWVPRKQNVRADRLVRDLLDAEIANRKDDQHD